MQSTLYIVIGVGTLSVLVVGAQLYFLKLGKTFTS